MSSDLIRDGNAYERIRFFNPVVTTGNAGLLQCRTAIFDLPSLMGFFIFTAGEGSISIQSKCNKQ